jgi:hypothetical protein
MRTLRWAAAGLAVALAAGVTSAADNEKVPFKTYKGYFESNRSGLRGRETFLAIGDRKQFDETFGVATVQGKKPDVLATDVFDGNMVLAAIRRGNSTWRYRVDGVTAKDGVLTLRYRSEATPGGRAQFSSPLIVSVPKGNYAMVVFVENGKKVGTAPAPK